jgi:hypothetical protein
MRGLRRWGSLLALVLLPWMAACGDSGPSGPGVVEVRVVPPPSADAGAVVVELAGAGILGFEAAGEARVFGAPVPGSKTSTGPWSRWIRVPWSSGSGCPTSPPSLRGV